MPLPLVRYWRSFGLSRAASRSFVLSLATSFLLHLYLLGAGAGIVLRVVSRVSKLYWIYFFTVLSV